MKFLNYKNISAVIILIAVFTGVFAHLNIVSVDIMESRNFVTAREMVQDNHWLVPTMNGELRIAKPPFPTWVTGVAMLLAGTDNNISANRIPSAIAGLVMLAGIFFISRQKSKEDNAGFFSVSVLATSFLFLYMVRRNTWDIYAVSFMTLSIGFILAAWKSETKQQLLKNYSLAGVLLGFSFLSKGPVAFYAMLLPFLAASFITNKPLRNINNNIMGWVILLIITIALSSVWPLYIYMNSAQEAVNIASKETAAWGSSHVQPFYYYLHFPIIAGIWMPVLIPLLFPKFTKNRAFSSNAKFYLLWLAIAILLLSVIPEKKSRYMLPLLIPCTLLISEYLSNITKEKIIKKADKIILMTLSASFILMAVSAFLSIIYLQIKFRHLNTFYLITTEAVFLFFITYSIYQAKKLHIKNIVNSVTAGFCLIFLLGVPAFSPLIKKADFRVLEQVRQSSIFNDYEFYSRDLGIKEIWAVGKKIGSWSEMREQFKAKLTRKTVYISTHPVTLKDLPGLHVNAMMNQIMILESYNKKYTWYLYFIEAAD